MKNEIKGILKDLEYASDVFDYTITPDRCTLLLDYITDLQQENEKLKELCDKYEEEHNTAFKLWKMKMEEIPTYEEKEDYKSRIDKAIKLIESYNLGKYDYTIPPGGIIEVLDILKGDSDE